MSDIDTFKLQPSQVSFVGKDLSRPECIIAQPDGTLWVADDRASLTRIGTDGNQELIGRNEGLPNGIAMTAQGDFFVADIVASSVYRIDRAGNKTIVLDSFEGRPLGAVNFVYLDERDRLWVAVSTVTEPRSNALKSEIADGYILLVDRTGVRRVAKHILFTNEVRIRDDRLYVAETKGGGVSWFKIADDGGLSDREQYGPWPLFPGAMVDGITFDCEGNLWVTELTRNSLIVIKPDGTAVTVFEDRDGSTIRVPTSVTFGGPDLKTAYVGSLKMNRIASFRSPIAGMPMRHWR